MMTHKSAEDKFLGDHPSKPFLELWIKTTEMLKTILVQSHDHVS